ncbi:MAG: transcription repressor NadR [Lachnospiraceae bacterium]|nr:transcription repressor NadR [Lachnospiraceae bacterium]
MKGKERRKELVALIMASDGPVSGTTLSEQLGVSRQIIVQDIAMLRAEGYDVLSTHQGYVISQGPFAERVFKLRHTSEQTEDELTTIVSLGGTIVNVFVWHKVYGKIEAGMNIFSVRGITQFMDGIKSGKSKELMHITEGYHYHLVRADSKKILDEIEQALDRKGYIVPEIK